MSDVSRDSFTRTEACITTTSQRLPGYPEERIRLVRLVAHIQRYMEQSSNRRLKPHGLNYSSYQTLMMLYGSPDFAISPSELSEATGERRTNITRICDELLATGLIERQHHAGDRRKVIVRLTPAGHALVESLQAEMWQSVENLYAGFSPAELQEFLRLLRKQLTNMNPTADPE